MACHGPGGNSPNPDIPSIAGQPKLFIENQLVLIREELRPSPQMLPVVQGNEGRGDQSGSPRTSPKLPAKSMETGKPDPKLAAAAAWSAPRRCAAACAIFRTSKVRTRSRGWPAQREAYLAAEMRAYRDDKRKGGDTIMAAALYGVSDADIEALAHFLSRLQ